MNENLEEKFFIRCTVHLLAMLFERNVEWNIKTLAKDVRHKSVIIGFSSEK